LSCRRSTNAGTSSNRKPTHWGKALASNTSQSDTGDPGVGAACIAEITSFWLVG